MIQCLIVDDEPLAHDIIIDYVSEIPHLEISAQCYRAIQAIEVLKTQKIDIVFLDIKMPKINGLQMLHIIEQKPQIIITTAYEEYALESYEFDVADYLLKPFRFDRFVKAIDIAKRNIERQSSSPTEDEYIIVKSDKRLIKIYPKNIQYLESYGNYIKIWVNDTAIITAQTMRHFITLLPQSDFHKIHKSFVINIKHFTYIEGNMVHMKNGNSLTISKSFKSSFMESIGR